MNGFGETTNAQDRTTNHYLIARTPCLDTVANFESIIFENEDSLWSQGVAKDETPCQRGKVETEEYDHWKQIIAYDIFRFYHEYSP